MRITGSRAGGLLAVGLEIFLWMTVPAFRVFLVGALLLGGLLGPVLWWKPRQGL